jgi:iron complex transport system substrate-binding protein
MIAALLWLLQASVPGPTAHFVDNVPPLNVERIVSLAPNVTESLFDIGVGGSVVGVTTFCNRPAAAVLLPRVGGYLDVSVEAVLALRPSVVVALDGAFASSALFPQLRARGVSILLLRADRLDDVRESLVVLGEVFGAERQAQQQLDTLGALVEPPTVSPAASMAPTPKHAVIVVGSAPIIAAGPASGAADVLRAAWPGVEVLPVSKSLWPQLSMESIATLPEDTVLVLAEGADRTKSLQQQLRAMPRAPRLWVPAASLFMRPTVRAYAEDVAALRTQPQSAPSTSK